MLPSVMSLPEDVPIIAPFVQFHKVASFEAGDEEFLEAHRYLVRPVFISSGMMGIVELYRTGRWLIFNRQHPMDALLHCISAYPCPVDQLCLRAIGQIRNQMIRPGFSDHSGLAFTGALAVAAGAEVIEVHIRLDDADLKNPDYPHALPPRKLRQYVENIRITEAAMGDGIKRLMPAEEAMRRFRVSG